MSTLTSPRTSGGQEHEPAPTRAQQKAHALGLTSATGLVVGSIIGTGVFAMPAVLASAAGYQSVYQSLIIVLAGVVLYALLKARRENPSAPADSAPSSASQQS